MCREIKMRSTKRLEIAEQQEQARYEAEVERTIYQRNATPLLTSAHQGVQYVSSEYYTLIGHVR